VKFSKNTNKKPLLRAVTLSRPKVYRKVARLKTFWPPLVRMRVIRFFVHLVSVIC